MKFGEWIEGIPWRELLDMAKNEYSPMLKIAGVILFFVNLGFSLIKKYLDARKDIAETKIKELEAEREALEFIEFKLQRESKVKNKTKNTGK